MILLGEGNVDVLLLADSHANHLIFKAVYEGVAADLEGCALSGAAFELDAGYAAGVVKVYGVAVLNGTLNINHACKLFALALHSEVHLVIRNIILALFYFYTLVLAQLYLGTHRNFCGKYQIIAIQGQLNYGNVGAVDNFQLVLLNSRLIYLGINHVKGIVKECQRTVGVLDHLTGSLALAESGHVELLAAGAVCLLDRLFELVCRYLDGKLNLAALELFQSCHYKPPNTTYIK